MGQTEINFSHVPLTLFMNKWLSGVEMQFYLPKIGISSVRNHRKVSGLIIAFNFNTGNISPSQSVGLTCYRSPDRTNSQCSNIIWIYYNFPANDDNTEWNCQDKIRETMTTLGCVIKHGSPPVSALRESCDKRFFISHKTSSCTHVAFRHKPCVCRMNCIHRTESGDCDENDTVIHKVFMSDGEANKSTLILSHWIRICFTISH